MGGGRPATRGAGQPLDERCALIAQLRERCPGVLPEAALPPGQSGEPIPVAPEQYGGLAAVAARQAAALATLGRLPVSDEDLPGVIIWEDGGAALAVVLAELELAVTEGGITVVVPVWCDQLPDRQGKVAVTFAVGTPRRHRRQRRHRSRWNPAGGDRAGRRQGQGGGPPAGPAPVRSRADRPSCRPMSAR